MIPDISVVVPVHDEQGAAGPLAREILVDTITRFRNPPPAGPRVAEAQPPMGTQR